MAICTVFLVTDMVHDGHLRCQAMMRVVILVGVTILYMAVDTESTNPGDDDPSAAVQLEKNMLLFGDLICHKSLNIH